MREGDRDVSTRRAGARRHDPQHPFERPHRMTVTADLPIDPDLKAALLEVEERVLTLLRVR